MTGVTSLVRPTIHLKKDLTGAKMRKTALI
jgi:hypothetical protein